MSCVAQQSNREIILPPSIHVKNLRQQESPVRISDVKIETRIVGALATTKVEMTFYNPNDRILEGELQFPLAEGQSISHFALDINGKLREGVVVEKAKGQEVFESVIRQGIDPGLLEKTQGNNFKTRVYPLPAKGNRRIVIGYEQELSRENENYRFFLPVEYSEKLDSFDLNVIVSGSDNTPWANNTPWGSFKFNKEGEAYIAFYSAKDFSTKGQIVFSIPVKNNQQVFVEKGKISDQTYFYSQIFPEIKNQPKQNPSRIALYWDTSSSMAKRNFKMEEELLAGYFNLIGDVTVELNTFNCILGKSRTFKIKNGNWELLKEVLKNMPYDGATQLGILNLSQIKADEVLLFTDGLSNFGKIQPIMGSTPVSVVNSVLSADHSMLNYIAYNTGGKYINLLRETPQEALKLMQNESYRLISADYNKSEINDLVTSGGIIKDVSGFSLAGRLNVSIASVILNFGIGNKVMYTQAINIESKNAGDYNNMVERIWAEKKISDLDLLYDKNKEEIEALGKKYNIVTRNTSLIVLDRVEDYVEHRITPPAELMQDYNKILDEIRVEDKKNKESQIENVVSYLNERKKWWNKNFPKAPPKEQKQVKDGEEEINRIMALYESENETRNRPERTVVSEYARPVEADMPAQSQSSPPTIQFTPPVIIADGRVNEESEMSSMDELSEENTSGIYSFNDNSSQNESFFLSELMNPEIPQPQYTGKIGLQGWNPDMPYLKELENKTNGELYNSYLKIKRQYQSTPSFYLDVAALFEKRGLKEETLIILSNLAEMEVENYRLLRVLAHKLIQLGYTGYGIDEFKIVLNLRPEEPQSYRDLALAYAQDKEYQKAVDMLYKVIERKWDSRFPEIELIAAEEMNAVIEKAKLNKVPLELNAIDKRLIYSMPVDIRIVLNWDTDNSDMDLWVIDPYGEKCFFDNTLTHIGGLISRDFTGGYGPEEFLIRKAVNGKYKIQANYYGSREQTIIGPTTVYLDIFVYYMNGKEKKETITLRLSADNDVIDIGEVSFSN